MKDEKTIVIDINLTRSLVALLALALLVVALLGYLAWGRDEVAASGPQAPLAQSSGMRQYYQTLDRYYGDEALTACASGYHMASLWEILDPSNLRYNSELGYQRGDSGQGPPTAWGGWVRTGYSSYYTSSTAGWANCDAWTSDDSDYWGTYVSLYRDWDSTARDIHVWNAGTYRCNTHYPVWCVED